MDTDSDATGREVAGVLMIFTGALGALVVLAFTLGWVASMLFGIAAVIGGVGYRLAASETGTGGTGSETEGDLGPGPLYVDPDDPDGLIPRR